MLIKYVETCRSNKFMSTNKQKTNNPCSFILVLNEYNIIFEQLTTAQATCHKPHKLRNDSHLNNQEILSMLLGNYCFCPLGFKTPTQLLQQAS